MEEDKLMTEKCVFDREHIKMKAEKTEKQQFVR